MRSTVTLTPAAKQDLANGWLHAQDRYAVTAASHLIDHLLANENRCSPRKKRGRTAKKAEDAEEDAERKKRNSQGQERSSSCACQDEPSRGGCDCGRHRVTMAASQEQAISFTGFVGGVCNENESVGFGVGCRSGQLAASSKTALFCPSRRANVTYRHHASPGQFTCRVGQGDLCRVPRPRHRRNPQPGLLNRSNRRARVCDSRRASSRASSDIAN
jgi:hypothetical protein